MHLLHLSAWFRLSRTASLSFDITQPTLCNLHTSSLLQLSELLLKLPVQDTAKVSFFLEVYFRSLLSLILS